MLGAGAACRGPSCRPHPSSGWHRRRAGRIEPREFIAVLSGELTVEPARRSDVGVNGAGTQIGGPALVDREPHDATWEALTDLEVLVVNGPAYRWVWQTAGRSAVA